MDPAAFSLETATALISALTLFLSRLDSRRRRSAEIPNLRDSLIALYDALLNWIAIAQTTDRRMRSWAESGMPNSTIEEILQISSINQPRIVHAMRSQGTNDINRLIVTRAKIATRAAGILSGDAKSWLSVRNLLKLYGPELLQVVDTAIAERRRLIEKLSEELVRLRETSPEELAEALERLESTSQKLRLASTMLSEYIRDNFPLK